MAVYDMNQDLGVITIKEYDTSKKIWHIEKRVEYLNYMVEHHKTPFAESIIGSGLGMFIVGISFAVGSNSMGLGGAGVAILAGLFSYMNFRKMTTYKKRLQKEVKRLKLLEESDPYKNLEEKINAHKL